MMGYYLQDRSNSKLTDSVTLTVHEVSKPILSHMAIDAPAQKRVKQSSSGNSGNTANNAKSL